MNKDFSNIFFLYLCEEYAYCISPPGNQIDVQGVFVCDLSRANTPFIYFGIRIGCIAANMHCGERQD